MIVTESSRLTPAQQAVVEANLDLARCYTAKRADLCKRFGGDDVYQAAVLGLMHAVCSFDPDSGAALATWAYWHMRQAVQRMCRNVCGNKRTHIWEFPSSAYEAEDGWSPLDELAAADDDAGRQIEAREIVQRVLTLCRGREAEVCTVFLAGQAESIGEASRIVGLSKERTRQILRGLTKRSRHLM